MKNKVLQFSAGFILLFVFYHTAEYFVLFKNNAAAFLFFQCCFFIAAFFVAKWQGFKGISAWALKPAARWMKQLVSGMVMGIFLYTITFYVTMIVNGQQLMPYQFNIATFKPFLLFWFGSFFSSLSEDILTRGYLFKHIRSRTPSGLFVFAAALLYLLNHIYRFADGWQTIAYLFLLGVLFAIPLVYSGKLWYTAGMHWFGNATFFYTHHVWQTTGGDSSVSPNGIFVICILFMIPLHYLLLPKLPFMQPDDQWLAVFKQDKTLNR